MSTSDVYVSAVDICNAIAVPAVAGILVVLLSGMTVASRPQPPPRPPRAPRRPPRQPSHRPVRADRHRPPALPGRPTPAGPRAGTPWTPEPPYYTVAPADTDQP